MEINIIEESRNDLFSRKEVKLGINADVIPSSSDSKKIISQKFSCDENLVRVRKIESKFGTNEFFIIADIYDSQEEFDRVVKKTKQEIDFEKKAEEERLKAEAEAKKISEEESSKTENSTKEKIEETKE